ncbi:hypothetical protein K1T71_004607 [Dendrolimus kikuchii]|uniref:Uncharacterized protein n=1 Tax=Dendrolimus kikuchii TaxID=765133 RepID=A0ACC1D8K8_9NEOP|nr:hypothetical protein K1T71_004607 [Dendrolimus kikuchii]
MILLLSFIIVLAWTVLFRYRRRNMYKLAAAIKTYREREHLPIIGFTHKFSCNTEDVEKIMEDASYAAIENNGIIKGWGFHMVYFLVTDPADIEVILKTCLEKDKVYRFLRKFIKNGTIFAPVSIWRRRRKILIPAFSPKIVENFVEVFSEQSEKLAQELIQNAGKENIMWPFISSYTLDAVCETAMGVKVNAQGNPNTPFLVALNHVLNLVFKRIYQVWLWPDWVFQLLPQFKEHEDCKKIIHDFTDTVNVYEKGSFLDFLIHISGGENGYTNVELREEVLTLIVAGTDTSACAIGFTLKLLSKYPEVQEKVYQELVEVFDDVERPLRKDDLLELKYLERVIKESLRLFPPGPVIGRNILEDIKLPSGRILPAGTGVVVSIWGAHRDPKYWGPDAEHFDPDRFLPERFHLKHPCSFMPFSSGPRNCIGYHYALMSIKTSFASILRRFKVVGEPEKSPIPKMRLKVDIMLKAVDGYKVTLERRK